MEISCGTPATSCFSATATCVVVLGLIFLAVDMKLRWILRFQPGFISRLEPVDLRGCQLRKQVRLYEGGQFGPGRCHVRARPTLTNDMST